jgi:hypothetical protein
VSVPGPFGCRLALSREENEGQRGRVSGAPSGGLLREEGTALAGRAVTGAVVSAVTGIAVTIAKGLRRSRANRLGLVRSIAALLLLWWLRTH